ncbi:MAG: hypothetical protein Q4B05_02035 [Candidatus Saccharibacteria bacterium]|nr:hypothetical protein [Candidatus Saccharibacteria bacterium]
MDDPTVQQLFHLLSELREENNVKFDELRKEMNANIGGLREEMSTNINNLRAEMNLKFKESHEENHAQFAELNQKIDNIYTILDRQTGMLDTDETERLALSKQVDRHDDWIERAAPKVGVKYAVKG